MTLFDITAILLSAVAIGSFINYKWIKISSSIGLLLIAMVLGLVGILLNKIGLLNKDYIENFLINIDFKETVFHGVLSYLLFAGALQINLDDLKTAKVPVAITATVSTILSTIIIGIAFYYFSHLFGFTTVSFIHAMLFGAILSPTDPIAVLAIIKKQCASKKIETIFAGESLFNDGVAIVFFLSLLELMTKQAETTVWSVLGFLLLEVGGGMLIGFLLGWLANQMLTRIDSYHVEFFITLAVASGGYVLAEKLQLSAPLAMVVAGIIIGNQERRARTKKSIKYVFSFWEVTDEILNCILFFLIGLEMMVIAPSRILMMLGFVCIFIALFARFVSVAIPLLLLKPLYKSAKGTIFILTWGGLRGALSIAMVLSLPDEFIKDIFLPCVYFVVIFSIAVQGLSFSRVTKQYLPV